MTYGREQHGPDGPPARPDWYLARDGQQYGPISDPEVAKLIEFGHLRPSDLLWHEGLVEWQSAAAVIDARHRAALPVHAPAATHSPAPTAGPGPDMRAAQSAQGAPAWTGSQPGPAAGYAAPRGQHPVQAPAGNPYGTPDMAAMQQAPRAAVARQHGAPAARPGAGPDPRQGPGVARPGLAPSPYAADTGPDDEDDEATPRRGRRIARTLKRVAIVFFFASTLSAAAWYAYPYRAHFSRIMSSVTSVGGDATAKVPPMQGFASDAAVTDAAMQKALLWRTLKREFPDWYGARVKEASELAGQNQDDAQIGAQMMKAIVALRRQHAGDALSATPPKLKVLAATFADNLTRMRGISVDACFAMVTAGELSPTFMTVLQMPEHTPALQTQLALVFEAIAEGRRTPRIYPPPKQADYNILVTELEARGWTQADMQLFSDSPALARAPPAKICQLVTDWFQSQLAVKDPDVQLRLLADALKPVVFG